MRRHACKMQQVPPPHTQPRALGAWVCWLTRRQSVGFFARNCGLVTLGKMFMWEAEANRQALSTKRHNFLLGNLHLFFLLLRTQLGTVINNQLLHSENQPFHGSKTNQKECFHDCFFFYISIVNF